jgi:hypothetical protein
MSNCLSVGRRQMGYRKRSVESKREVLWLVAKGHPRMATAPHLTAR